MNSLPQLFDSLFTWLFCLLALVHSQTVVPLAKIGTILKYEYCTAMEYTMILLIPLASPKILTVVSTVLCTFAEVLKIIFGLLLTSYDGLYMDFTTIPLLSYLAESQGAYLNFCEILI